MTNEPVLENRNDAAETARLAGLYDQYAAQGVRYAFSMLRQAADAEEVTHEAFCRLLAKNCSVGEFESRLQNFPAQFFTTIRHLCVDLMRQNRRQRSVALDASVEPAARSTTDQLCQLEAKVVAVLGQMPNCWAEALQLKINGQLSYAEIAEVLDATHAQVRTWIYRARRHLEKELKQTGWNTVGP